MRQSLFVALMLCLTPVLAGCLDSLTGDEELRVGCTYSEAENWDPLAQIDDGSCVLREPAPEVATDTHQRYNKFLKLVTGFNAKQRADRAKAKAKAEAKAKAAAAQENGD